MKIRQLDEATVQYCMRVVMSACESDSESLRESSLIWHADRQLQRHAPKQHLTHAVKPAAVSNCY